MGRSIFDSRIEEAQKVSIEKCFDMFIDAKRSSGASPSTLRTYGFHWAVLRKHFDTSQDIGELDTVTIRKAVSEIA